MDRKKTAREVSLGELHNWLKENSHLTWCLNKNYGPGAFGSSHEEASPIIKYIYPYFDTRDMHIYHINTEGFGKYAVDFREEFDGTILDLLLYKIKNKITLKKDQSGDDMVHEVMIKRFNDSKVKECKTCLGIGCIDCSPKKELKNE